MLQTGWKAGISGDHPWSGAGAATGGGSRDRFRPSYQLCTVPKSASAHADTCSLTHTAVARIQSVHARHCCVLQVWWGCTNREWWWCTAVNKSNRKEEGVAIKGRVRRQTVCTDEHSEWKSGLVGHVEMINLDLSGTPVSRQRHVSRKIGLHPLATAVLPCFLLFLLLLFSSQGFKSASVSHFLILPYLNFILLSLLPGQELDFAPVKQQTQIYGKQVKVQNETLIGISWCDLWLLRAFKVSVSTTSAPVQQRSGQRCLRNFTVSIIFTYRTGRLLWAETAAGSTFNI